MTTETYAEIKVRHNAGLRQLDVVNAELERSRKAKEEDKKKGLKNTKSFDDYRKAKDAQLALYVILKKINVELRAIRHADKPAKESKSASKKADVDTSAAKQKKAKDKALAKEQKAKDKAALKEAKRLAREEQKEALELQREEESKHPRGWNIPFFSEEIDDLNKILRKQVFAVFGSAQQQLITEIETAKREREIV